MERQYETLKAEAKDALLFFRVGDFYEMFHDDAKKAAEILDIALTSRNKNAENPVPMCGVPVKAAERYIAKLTQAGEKIAIAEQVSDPSMPGIVERKIVSIVTPGTTLSDQILEEKKSRFITSIVEDNTGIAAVFCDVSTGSIELLQSPSMDEIVQQIIKKPVVEIIFTPQGFSEHSSLFSYFSGSMSRFFVPENPRAFLLSFFKLQTLKSLDIEDHPSIQKAMALLMAYLEETQKIPMVHISHVQWIQSSQSMRLDANTIKTLELFTGSDGEAKHGLISCIDNTKTAIGGRHLQRIFLNPVSDKKVLEERLEMVETLQKDTDFHTILQKALAQVSDIERIIGKMAMQKAIPRDAVLLSQSLVALQSLIPSLQTLPQTHAWKPWAMQVESLFDKIS